MILVNIKCPHCWITLKQIESRPQSWDGELWVSRCRRCDMPSPGRLADHLVKTGRSGMSPWAVVPWAVLREAIEQAERTHKPQDVPLFVTDN